MRIISKFSDFYDGVMRTGMDKEVVYVREKKDVLLKKPFDIDFSTTDSRSWSNGQIVDTYKVCTVFLGFCGSIYKIFTVTSDEWRYVFYNYEEFKTFMLNSNMGSKYDFREGNWWPSKYYKFRNHDTSKMTELFHQFQTPLFLLNHEYYYSKPGKTTITLGPCLKDLKFQTIKDPYTTYQDIFQYVAGTLNKPENKMVEISDKDKISKHGFDRWSFKKLPTKRKKK